VHPLLSGATVIQSALPAVVAFLLAAADPSPPQLLRQPTLSRTQVAFSFAGDLWIVGREGGDARRLTVGIGVESEPRFSPDGTLIAFTGQYDGNRDVYVVPAVGGEPRRITWHPSDDVALGWTPDGSSILFRSARDGLPRRRSLLYTVPVDGGLPTPLPLPRGDAGSFSPDGKRLAYTPFTHFQKAWKQYRGGATGRVWIADLSDSSIVKVPRENSNDEQPQWLADRVYFLSDRDGPVTLHAWNPATNAVTRLVENRGMDLKWLSAGPDALVYEQFGAIFLFDPGSGTSRKLEIRVSGDLPELRSRWVNVAKKLRAPGLSPNGARAVFEARGEILTVPAEKGSVRNLTRSPGVADRDPAWSPDGTRIAWFSDAPGEYVLLVADASGLGTPRRIDLGTPPSFFYRPVWSPDSRKIAYTDKRLNLWWVDVEKGSPPVKVGTDATDRPDRRIAPSWSPDSRWIAYAKGLRNQMSAVYLYSLDTGKTTAVTDGMADALHPAFDAGGKVLYFTVSTDVGPATAWLDISSLDRPVTRLVHAAVLKKGEPSPVAPESDEEKTPAALAEEEKEKKDAEKRKEGGKDKKETPRTVIDLDGLAGRVVPLPLPGENVLGLVAGTEGVLFVLQTARLFEPEPDGAAPFVVQRYDGKKRKAEKLLENALDFVVSASGEKMLWCQGPVAPGEPCDRWFTGATGAPPKAGEGALPVVGAEVWVVPREEWRQMYREAWRIERDFLYDPGFHGLDLAATERKYSPWVDGLASRNDLDTLFAEMLGELRLGHVYMGNGDSPTVAKGKAGLLGADFELAAGRYRVRRVYEGDLWNPAASSPLSQPGSEVRAGEFLLSVDGRDLLPPRTPDELLDGTAGKLTTLRVGPSADGKGSREVKVVPTGSDAALRTAAWVERNRRTVDARSGGRLAYVWLPDTYRGGMNAFLRDYFAQVGKEGAVVDERWNGGGSVADWFVDQMRRVPLGYTAGREGDDTPFPAAAIFGPKVMVINESAGSGGDALPWMFRNLRIGTLVGTRTWGGLVGIWDYPSLVDGGTVTAPRGGLYGMKGEWEVEGSGVPPDIEVEEDPRLARAGRDVQLEKAVDVALEELARNPLPRGMRPAYPRPVR
jgi:tricorn protease